MPLIRYPGSKEKLGRQIRDYFPWSMRCPLWSDSERMEYREPFFGSGAIGMKIFGVLHSACAVWLNDIDPGVYSLWRAVLEKPNKLCQLIGEFEPTAERFYEFKQHDDQPSGDIVVDGFRKLALHRLSYSGFGYMSGGPLGGKDGNSEYDPACRWRPARLQRDVQRIHREFRRFADIRITCQDFGEMVETAGANCFVYLDPPYYEKGVQLYKHNMSDADHERLASLLQWSRSHWVLSYDDHARIRDLYSWAQFEEIPVTYTVATSRDVRRPKNKEVVIVPHTASAASA